MPVVLDTPIRAMSAQEEIREDRQNIVVSQVQPNAYLFNLPVKVYGGKVDFTDIPAGSRLIAVLNKGQEPTTFNIRDGVQVRILDPYRSHAKITVKTESGDTFKGRGYACLVNDKLVNLNGKFKFQDPNAPTSSMTNYISIKAGTYQFTQDINPEHFIVCRHFALEALRHREYDASLSWKESRETFFGPYYLPYLFNDLQAYEDSIVDINAATENIFSCYKYDLGPYLDALFECLSRGIEPGTMRESKFYVVLSNANKAITDGKHACALILRSKCDANGLITKKIKLYDPNLTLNHMSFAEDQTIPTIRALDFKDLFARHDLYEDFDVVQLFEMNRHWNLGITQAGANDHENSVVNIYQYYGDTDELELADVSSLKDNLERLQLVKVGS